MGSLDYWHSNSLMSDGWRTAIVGTNLDSLTLRVRNSYPYLRVIFLRKKLPLRHIKTEQFWHYQLDKNNFLILTFSNLIHSAGRHNWLLSSVKASGKVQVHLSRGIKLTHPKSSREHCRMPCHTIRSNILKNLHLFRYTDQDGEHLHIY
jgi:hypothetical protein